MPWFDKLNEVLNAVHNGVIAINDEEKITIYNRQAERILGVPANQVIGQKITDFLPASGLIAVLHNGRAEYGQKTQVNHREVMTNRSPIFDGEKVVGAIAVFQDISELESLATELRQVKELNKELEAILESFYDGIGIISGDGTLLRVNSSYERITGLSKNENGVGRNVRELQEDGTVSQAVALLVLSKKKTVTIKQRIKTGKEILITGSPVINEKGEVFRVVCNIRDMTELNVLREKMETTEKQNQEYASQIQELRKRLLEHNEFIFRSSAMENVFQLVARVANVDSTVLIMGESGVGKEIVAKLIHEFSPRVQGPFHQINCGAIPENLLESELFGYEEGSFTGARSGGKKGIFELCQGGTLLLDEIGELPINMQVKLLRVLQQQEVYRLGGTKPIKLDVHILAATNKNLEEMIEQKLFRADLFYRLNVVPIFIPPLRERPEDIIPLALHFLEKFNSKHHSNKRLEQEILLAFERYNWPGNARELENLIERMVIINDESLLNLKHLPLEVCTSECQSLVVQINKLLTLDNAVAILEKELIRKTMQAYPTTRKAAKILGVSHPTVIRKMQKYNLNNCVSPMNG